MWIAWVELRSPAVGIESIADLVVAGFVESAQVVPHLRDVWIKSDCTRVCVESITVLVDLVVKHTDGAPECWIATISIDSLLICFVGFVVLPLSHVTSTQKIPALRIRAIRFERFRQILYGQILISKFRTLLVI